MSREDGLRARVIAGQCWDAETLHGSAWERFDSNDGLDLPRGLAHQGRYALRLLGKFDADLERILDTAGYCRRAAQEEGRERQAIWMRAADLCELAVARVTNIAGPDHALQQAVAHRLLNPPPNSKEGVDYRVVWVAQLPNPHHLSKAPCLRVLTRTQRWTRQLRPVRGPRSCCRYHGGDWHQASQVARHVLHRARRGTNSTEECYKCAKELLEGSEYSVWVRKAALSLLDPADGIIVGRLGGHDEPFLVGGQHRTQALVDAGVRRTVVLVER